MPIAINCRKGYLLAVFVPTLLFWSAHLLIYLEVCGGACASLAAIGLNGNLQAGQSVDIMLVSTMTQSLPTSQIYENLLVLDVQATHAAQAEQTVNAQLPFVIVLAIPLAERNEFSIAYSKAASVLVALHPQP